MKRNGCQVPSTVSILLHLSGILLSGIFKFADLAFAHGREQRLNLRNLQNIMHPFPYPTILQSMVGFQILRRGSSRWTLARNPM